MAVGGCEGTLRGASERAGVGTGVGAPLEGMGVGWAEGVALGLLDGVMVRKLVGAVVGLPDGTALGILEGADVGITVGTALDTLD